MICLLNVHVLSSKCPVDSAVQFVQKQKHLQHFCCQNICCSQLNRSHIHNRKLVEMLIEHESLHEHNSWLGGCSRYSGYSCLCSKLNWIAGSSRYFDERRKDLLIFFFSIVLFTFVTFECIVTVHLCCAGIWMQFFPSVKTLERKFQFWVKLPFNKETRAAISSDYLRECVLGAH